MIFDLSTEREQIKKALSQESGKKLLIGEYSFRSISTTHPDFPGHNTTSL